jgi:hypothetical protein
MCNKQERIISRIVWFFRDKEVLFNIDAEGCEPVIYPGLVQADMADGLCEIKFEFYNLGPLDSRTANLDNYFRKKLIFQFRLSRELGLSHQSLGFVRLTGIFYYAFERKRGEPISITAMRVVLEIFSQFGAELKKPPLFMGKVKQIINGPYWRDFSDSQFEKVRKQFRNNEAENQPVGPESQAKNI